MKTSSNDGKISRLVHKCALCTTLSGILSDYFTIGTSTIISTYSFEMDLRILFRLFHMAETSGGMNFSRRYFNKFGTKFHSLCGRSAWIMIIKYIENKMLISRKLNEKFETKRDILCAKAK